MKRLLLIAWAASCAVLSSCISIPDRGDEGQACFKDGTCLPGLECGSDNLCVKPGEAGDSGSSDTSADSGADASHPSDASFDDAQDGSDDAADAGRDAGVDVGAPDTGEDAALADAGVDAAEDTGQDIGPDAGEDTGVADTGADIGLQDTSVQDTGTDGGYDGGSDAGSPDTGIVISCGPSPTGKGGDMCDVAAGAYMMGCNTAVDTECYGDGREDPYHSVTVPAFKIDKYEVPASEYLACVTASGCTAANTGSGCNYNVGGKETHPINCVDWNQAKAYCTWAGKKLPTEAEWEKAARGTDGRKYPWGNEVLDCNRAVHSVSPCSNSGTATVGSKPTGASPYGAMDMVGNVWEWVEDDYHSSYTGAPANGSAWVDVPRATSRVLRGGSWGVTLTGGLRASYRLNFDPTSWNLGIGFRCAVAQ